MSHDDELTERADSWELRERVRAEYLACHAPDLVSREPNHSCEIDLPDGGSFWFEEFDPDGRLCGASADDRPYTLGAATEVIATASGLPEDDEWVQRVVAVLRRERATAGPGGWRRPMLTVKRGTGWMSHVTAAVNRDSIRRHGLDWTKMGAVTGVAGSTAPELPAIFLCEDDFDAAFFIRMARQPTDVWEVRVDGFWVENGPDGWWIIDQPVGPDRLRLARKDVRGDDQHGADQGP
jgi:hypothetical protein